MSLLQIEDVQGIILHTYGKLPSAGFLVLGITQPDATKAWMRTLEIRDAQRGPSAADTCINIAFTRRGLAKLGLAEEFTTRFAGEFLEGMAGTEHRQRILGDVGECSPERWTWGGSGNPQPDVLLMLYAGNADALARSRDKQVSRLSGSGLDLLKQLEANRLPFDKEHFGFRDGVSQPGIAGFRSEGEAFAGNSIAAGEFVLGYPNAYGQYTERPLLPSDVAATALPEAADKPGALDLGKNGSYLVFRQLSQDVSAFWRFVDEKTRNADGSANPERRIRLAAKMVGRWPGGAPLVKWPDADIPAPSKENDFLYHGSGDVHGFKCPIGSHIRRANPRDSLEPQPGSERSIEVGKRHRIIRRGRAYGSPIARSMEVAHIVAADAGASGERGLHFICFNTHIGRQFEFIQHTWINSPKFDGLYEDDDPLIGDRGESGRAAGGQFTIQAEPIRERVRGMPRFVMVRGGAYFFMPGIRAVRYLASLP